MEVCPVVRTPMLYLITCCDSFEDMNSFLRPERTWRTELFRRPDFAEELMQVSNRRACRMSTLVNSSESLKKSSHSRKMVVHSKQIYASLDAVASSTLR